MRTFVSLTLSLAACQSEPPKGGSEREPCTDCVCSEQTVPSAEPDSCLVPVAVFDGTTDLVISVDWSPIDDFVLSGANGEVRLLEVAGDPPSFRDLASYRTQGGRAFVIWSPDGNFALSASTDVRLLRIDRENETIAEAAPAFTGHLGDVYSAAWSPDGIHALSVGQDGTARLLAADATAGTLDEVARFDGGTGKVYDVAFSPDGELAAIAAQDGTLRILAVDAERGSLVEVARSLLDSWVTAVGWSPRGDEILAGTWLPCGTVELWSLEAPASLGTVGVFAHHESGVRIAHFGKNGDFAVTAGHDDTLRLFALPASPNEVETVVTWSDNAYGVHGVTLSPDAQRLVVAASHIDRLTLLDTSACPLP
jgi:WD40 repeat protein